MEPSVVVRSRGEPPVALSETIESVSSDSPPARVENRIVSVRMSSPSGPAWSPVVQQPKLTVPAPLVGGEQITGRPVEPRNAPSLALMKDSIASSHDNVNSYAPRSIASATRMSTETVEAVVICADGEMKTFGTGTGTGVGAVTFSVSSDTSSALTLTE